MSTKVAIVTGANKGIGFAVVKALSKEFDGTVYLTAPDETLGLKAVQECEQLGIYPKFHQLDIDNEASVVTFKEYLLDNYPDGIDILINNAGIAFKTDAKEPFGFQAEETTRINFLGPLNLCQELFPMLKDHGRVVNVSSSFGYLGMFKSPELKKQLGDPHIMYKELINLIRNFVETAKEGKHQEAGWPNNAYQVSKMAVSVMTRIQQREFNERFPERDLVVNHVHPGYIATDLCSNQGTMTPEYGAQAIVWAALLPPNVEKPRGDFIWHDKQIVDWVNGPLPGLY